MLRVWNRHTTGPAPYCIPMATLWWPRVKGQVTGRLACHQGSHVLHKWHCKYKLLKAKEDKALEELTSAAVHHNRMGWTIKCILKPTLPPECSYVEVFLSVSSSRAAKCDLPQFAWLWEKSTGHFKILSYTGNNIYGTKSLQYEYVDKLANMSRKLLKHNPNPSSTLLSFWVNEWIKG